jgi:tetratricopeptide (TPR) repeat protein
MSANQINFIGIKSVFLLCLVSNFLIKTIAADKSSAGDSLNVTQFWVKFSESILQVVRGESDLNRKSAIISNGAEMVSNNKSDRFACKALYDLALESYKSGYFSNSIELANRALLLPQTLPGDHLLLWNLIAESHKSNGNYSDSLFACDKVLLTSGPDVLFHDLHQAAMTRKADLMLMSTNISYEDRQKVERLLKPLTEIATSSSISAPRGQLLRGRIQNLKNLGQTNDAFEVGRYFIVNNPKDYYSPVIAADLCVLTNKYSSVDDVDLWVRFFVAKNATNTAAFANLKMDLMNAHARVGHFDVATKIAEELSRFRAMPEDPLPWSSSHLDEVDNLKTISQGEMLRLKENRLLPSGAKPKSEQWFIASLLAFCSLFGIVVIYRILGRS